MIEDSIIKNQLENFNTQMEEKIEKLVELVQTPLKIG